MANKYNKAAIREELVNKLAIAEKQAADDKKRALAQFDEWQKKAIEKLEEKIQIVRECVAGEEHPNSNKLTSVISSRPDLVHNQYHPSNIETLKRAIKEIDLIDGTTIQTGRGSNDWLVLYALQ